MMIPLVIFVSFFASRQAYKLIHFIGISKRLFSKPNSRSSHEIPVPQFGGVGLYFSTCITASVFVALIAFNNFESFFDMVDKPGGVLAFISGLTLIFYTGFVDDLIDMKAWVKFLFQFTSVAIVVLPTHGYLDNFFEIFGIDTLPNTIAIIFTFFVYLLIINAFNLIDGIDGLASSLGISASLFFGVYFSFINRYDLVILNFALIGSLVGFLFSNFSKTKKLFLGDSGSMVIGICIAFQSVQFMGLSLKFEDASIISHAPIYILSVVAYPLIDILRVMLSRISKKKSPFMPDRNHIHHKLIDLGMSHIQATALIIFYTLSLIVITFATKNLSIHWHLLLMMTLALGLAMFPVALHKARFRSQSPENIKPSDDVLKTS